MTSKSVSYASLICMLWLVITPVQAQVQLEQAKVFAASANEADIPAIVAQLEDSTSIDEITLLLYALGRRHAHDEFIRFFCAHSNDDATLVDIFVELAAGITELPQSINDHSGYCSRQQRRIWRIINSTAQMDSEELFETLKNTKEVARRRTPFAWRYSTSVSRIFKILAQQKEQNNERMVLLRALAQIGADVPSKLATPFHIRLLEEIWSVPTGFREFRALTLNAYKQDPEHSFVGTMRALLSVKQGQIEDAVQYLPESGESSSALSHLLRGFIETLRGDLDVAIESLSHEKLFQYNSLQLVQFPFLLVSVDVDSDYPVFFAAWTSLIRTLSDPYAEDFAHLYAIEIRAWSAARNSYGLKIASQKLDNLQEALNDDLYLRYIDVSSTLNLEADPAEIEANLRRLEPVTQLPFHPQAVNDYSYIMATTGRFNEAQMRAWLGRVTEALETITTDKNKRAFQPNTIAVIQDTVAWMNHLLGNHDVAIKYMAPACQVACFISHEVFEHAVTIFLGAGQIETVQKLIDGAEKRGDWQEHIDKAIKQMQPYLLQHPNV